MALTPRAVELIAPLRAALRQTAGIVRPSSFDPAVDRRVKATVSVVPVTDGYLWMKLMRAEHDFDALLKALEGPTSVGRREMLTALGQMGDGSAAEVVARDLYHDMPEIRAAAASALARIGTSAQADALDALKSDYYRRVREAAVAALEKSTTAAEGAR